MGDDNTQATPKLHPSCDELDQKILLLLKEQPQLSQTGLANVLEVNVNNIKSRISKLKKLEIIERKGTSQKGYWIIKKDI